MIIRHELPVIVFTVRRRRAAKFQNPVKSDQPDLKFQEDNLGFGNKSEATRIPVSI